MSAPDPTDMADLSPIDTPSDTTGAPAPVKMMNPWLAFCKETRHEVRHLGPQQQLREMGVMWKALSEVEKEPFRFVPKALPAVLTSPA